MLAGVHANFKGYPGFEVIALDRGATETELLAFDPSVVVFDLSAFQSEVFLSQMQAHPGLLLIGVDLESHEVLLTGQAVCSMTLDQLTQIVQDLLQPGIAHPIAPSTNGP